jgi:hypothetical protein
MSITVWAAPAFRLKSRHVLRFLTESRSPIRAVEAANSVVRDVLWVHARSQIARTPTDFERFSEKGQTTVD